MLAERGAGDVPPGELDAMYDSLLTASLELLGRLDLRYLAADQLPAAPPTAAAAAAATCVAYATAASVAVSQVAITRRLPLLARAWKRSPCFSTHL